VALALGLRAVENLQNDGKGRKSEVKIVQKDAKKT